MKIYHHLGARIDVLEAVEYYEQTGEAGLAADFFAEVAKFIDNIADRPKSFPVHLKKYRRANLYRFPYNILFRVVDDKSVRILAVRHNNRHPKYGTNRS